MADKQTKISFKKNGILNTTVWGCTLCGVVAVKPFDAKVVGGKDRLGISLNIHDPIHPRVVCNNCKQTEWIKRYALSGNITTARLSAAAKSTVSLVICCNCAKVVTGFQIHGLDTLCTKCMKEVQTQYTTSACVCGSLPAEDAVPFVAKCGGKFNVYKGCTLHKWLLPTDVYQITPDVGSLKSLLKKGKVSDEK